MLANRQTACLMHANSPGFTTDTMNNSVERREKKGGGGKGRKKKKAPSTLPFTLSNVCREDENKKYAATFSFPPIAKKNIRQKGLLGTITFASAASRRFSIPIFVGY